MIGIERAFIGAPPIAQAAGADFVESETSERYDARVHRRHARLLLAYKELRQRDFLVKGSRR